MRYNGRELGFLDAGRIDPVKKSTLNRSQLPSHRIFATYIGYGCARTGLTSFSMRTKIRVNKGLIKGGNSMEESPTRLADSIPSEMHLKEGKC